MTPRLARLDGLDSMIWGAILEAEALKLPDVVYYLDIATTSLDEYIDEEEADE